MPRRRASISMLLGRRSAAWRRTSARCSCWSWATSARLVLASLRVATYVRSGLTYSATSSTPTKSSAKRPSLSQRTRGAVICATIRPQPARSSRCRGSCRNTGTTLRPQDLPPEELRVGAERLLDAQELVVLRDAIGARRRAGLDLPAAGRDGEVGDRRVLGLAGAVRHDRAVAGGARGRDRVERLGQRADLVDLHEDRVR